MAKKPERVEIGLIPAHDENPIARELPFKVLVTGNYSEGLKVLAAVGPVIGGAAGAWFQARYGRKVRLKVGELEAEAQTVEEVEKLLEKAFEIQSINLPKVIHEP